MKQESILQNQNSENIILLYKHPVLFYFLSISISWLFWFGAGYISNITSPQDKYKLITSIMALGGLITPLAVASFLILKNNRLRKDVAGRLLNFHGIKPIYISIACCTMLSSIVLAQAISLLFGYSPEQFIISTHFTFSSGFFPVWGLLIIAPIIEELAWHSYGIDCLRRKFNLFTTSAIFGVIWGVWHMPLSTIRDMYQSNLVNDGVIYGINFLVSVLVFAILINWIYYKTGRNIVIAIVFHITAGLFNELFAPHPDTKIIQTIILMILALVIVIKEKKLFFDKVQFQPN